MKAVIITIIALIAIVTRHSDGMLRQKPSSISGRARADRGYAREMREHGRDIRAHDCGMREHGRDIYA